MEQEVIKSSREIGREIAAFFKEHNISQQDAANRLGFASKQVVANQLSGKRFGRATAAKYALVFGFDELFLLTGKGCLLPFDQQYERLLRENEDLRALCLSQQETIRSLSSATG